MIFIVAKLISMINTTKIYLVTNIDNDPNKVYIGKTKNSTRELNHKARFGPQITFNYIDEVNSLDHNDWEPLETKWIQHYTDLGYNVVNQNKGGGGPEFHTKYTCDKISKSKTGQKYPKEHGEKLSKAFKGRTVSKEVREKISKSSKGISRNKGKKPLLGKHPSLETRQKMSKPKSSTINMKKSVEVAHKIAIAHHKPIIQYDLNNNLIKEWSSVKEAAESLMKNNGGISSALTGVNKTAYGYIWRYKMQST